MITRLFTWSVSPNQNKKIMFFKWLYFFVLTVKDDSVIFVLTASIPYLASNFTIENMFWMFLSLGYWNFVQSVLLKSVNKKIQSVWERLWTRLWEGLGEGFIQQCVNYILKYSQNSSKKYQNFTLAPYNNRVTNWCPNKWKI